MIGGSGASWFLCYLCLPVLFVLLSGVSSPRVIHVCLEKFEESCAVEGATWKDWRCFPYIFHSCTTPTQHVLPGVHLVGVHEESGFRREHGITF